MGQRTAGRRHRASNLLGTMHTIPRIAQLAHDREPCSTSMGCHYAAHRAVDLAALGADFIVCSRTSFLARTARCSPPTRR